MTPDDTAHDADPYEDPLALSEPVLPKPPAVPADGQQPPAPEPAAPYPPPPSVRLMGPPPGELQHAGFTCPFCGYDLTGAVVGGNCPECGSHINPHMLTTVRSSGMALASMIMGILAIVFGLATFGLATWLIAPMGIIFGHVGQRQTRTGRYTPSSHAFAKAGLICSYIALILVVVVWGLFFLLVM